MSPDQLIHLGQVYANARGLALSTVGRIAGGQGRFFHRVADGRVTLRRVERVAQWFSDHWPAELPWPDGVLRPEPAHGSPAAMGETGGAAGADPLQAVRASLELAQARAGAGDLAGARNARNAAFEAGTRLRSDGRIASAAALCEALQLSGHVYYDVVRRFSGRRGRGRRTRRGSASDRMLRALLAAGDTRFSLYGAYLAQTGAHDPRHDASAPEGKPGRMGQRRADADPAPGPDRSDAL